MEPVLAMPRIRRLSARGRASETVAHIALAVRGIAGADEVSRSPDHSAGHPPQNVSRETFVPPRAHGRCLRNKYQRVPFSLLWSPQARALGHAAFGEITLLYRGGGRPCAMSRGADSADPTLCVSFRKMFHVKHSDAWGETSVAAVFRMSR